MIFQGPSQPSGSLTRVTVLHDSAHINALRFLVPGQGDELLNVREPDEGTEELASSPETVPRSDADGLAPEPVCGSGPIRLANFGF